MGSPGMKIDLAQVQAAEQVVATALTEMEGITKRILAQAGMSEVAMKAPAGQITSTTFNDLGGGGRALAETLDQLKADLVKLRHVAMEGSDQATQAARGGASGSPSGAVYDGM
ncbi:hypothetical protein LWC34_01900 [Kibdelosporangium philippinense]|uniref:Uncharacterized protein n=1 Tax=Kibdelosporangium philippinense TaxID=211113 RepID=A0ABS8Z4K8_9PSEU|nr:hypothetical protein [Kibdelosporangium philippinense]MCE7001601.1 hypothetical protein [Kibdelosporangium philippinense]